MPMRRSIHCLLLASLIGSSNHKSAIADIVTFASGENQFQIEFVPIKHTSNRADTLGNPNPVGAVRYNYYMGKYEISRSAVTRANNAWALGITLDAMQGINDGTNPNKPATGVSWIEAAKFVNQLNTSRGFQAAYNFNSNGQLTTWGASEAWQPSSSNDPENGDRTNWIRHKNAAFWIPSVDESYKSAYYDPNKNGVGGYNNYATGGDNLPTAVEQGTAPGTAVFGLGYSVGPATIDNAGGLSPLGTMAQNGNVWEWTETEVDLINDSSNANRITRGGSWYLNEAGMSRTERFNEVPGYEAGNAGFRIAANFSAVPEPASLSLVSACAGFAFVGRCLSRRFKTKKNNELAK